MSRATGRSQKKTRPRLRAWIGATLALLAISTRREQVESFSEPAECLSSNGLLSLQSRCKPLA
jgi:hypothetical protein